MSDWSLSGKVVLVTGAAGGIGAATSAELARRGARLVLADLDADALARTAEAIPGDPLTVPLDVTEREACAGAVAAAQERFGRLDAVWANAGIAAFGPVELIDPVAWTRVIEVNLLGAYNTVQAALPAVLDARGYVAITASGASFAQPPGMSAYGASKAGVEAMANALRSEVAEQGVEVGTIHPTWISTPMVTESDSEMPAFQRMRETLRPPFSKTYPVEAVVPLIADGFEQRAMRVCAPRFMRIAHVARPFLSTKVFNRDFRKAAPEIRALFAEHAARAGSRRAALSERVERQVT